ncbi:MAG: M24 family metallopeptidase [Candidatus Gracilibacteria bacterium]|nr:M24 family metallopeptidase [Candidatus Gracilibacteria bacterium]
MKTHIFITDSDFSSTDKTFEYLLGFQPTFGGMVLSDNSIHILLDSRYIGNKDKVDLKNISNKTGIKNIEFIEFSKGWEGLLEKIIKLTLNSDLIFIENNIASKYYKYLKDNTGRIIELNDSYFGKQRLIKQDNEVENIKKAIEIIDKVFIYIEYIANTGILIGKTENQVRSIILNKIFENGGDGESFESIVAFGKNSAIPHHKTGNDLIGHGPLMIDIGAKYKGYCSDFTRTIRVGDRTEEYAEFKKIYEIVRDAHNEAINNFKAGFLGQDLDKLAREYITKKGFGEYFSHSLGHGVGLDIHESPRISAVSTDKIENGMVFTIEPGIYLENKFGVRLEDIVFVENSELKKHTKVNL